MRRVGIRYLFLCVSLIAACLAYMQIPVPSPTVIDINGDIESGPNAIHSILFNLRPLAFVGAISLFMHAVCTLAGLNNSHRWIVSILLPTIAMFTWNVLWVGYMDRNEIPHKITISPWTVLVINMVSFTIGTAVIAGLLALLTPLVENKNSKQRQNRR